MGSAKNDDYIIGVMRNENVNGMDGIIKISGFIFCFLNCFFCIIILHLNRKILYLNR